MCVSAYQMITYNLSLSLANCDSLWAAHIISNDFLICAHNCAYILIELITYDEMDAFCKVSALKND